MCVSGFYNDGLCGMCVQSYSWVFEPCHSDKKKSPFKIETLVMVIFHTQNHLIGVILCIQNTHFLALSICITYSSHMEKAHIRMTHVENP